MVEGFADQPRRRHDQGIKGALVAFGAEGALEKTVTLPWGDFSGAALMWLAVNDQFVHGWDLARAIGHDTDLDPGLADELLVRGQAWITDAYRGPHGAGLFGPAARRPWPGRPRPTGSPLSPSGALCKELGLAPALSVSRLCRHAVQVCRKAASLAATSARNIGCRSIDGEYLLAGTSRPSASAMART